MCQPSGCTGCKPSMHGESRLDHDKPFLVDKFMRPLFLFDDLSKSVDIICIEAATLLYLCRCILQYYLNFYTLWHNLNSLQTLFLFE